MEIWSKIRREVLTGALSKRAAPPEAHESLISRKTVEEVPLTGLSLSFDDGQA